MALALCLLLLSLSLCGLVLPFFVSPQLRQTNKKQQQQHTRHTLVLTHTQEAAIIMSQVKWQRAQGRIYGSIASVAVLRGKKRKGGGGKYLTICVIFLLLQIANICFNYSNNSSSRATVECGKCKCTYNNNNLMGLNGLSRAHNWPELRGLRLLSIDVLPNLYTSELQQMTVQVCVRVFVCVFMSVQLYLPNWTPMGLRVLILIISLLFIISSWQCRQSELDTLLNIFALGLCY